MAPGNARKRKSDEMEETPRAVTPTGSPVHKKMKITQTQKQALMDNLQLESEDGHMTIDGELSVNPHTQ